MSSNFLKSSIIFLFFVLVIGTPLFYGGLPRIFSFQFISQQIYPYTFSKELFFQALVELIFGLWLALIIVDRRYRPKLTPALKALFVFLAVLTLAALFGVDPWRSFWSTYERGVGAVAVYHLAALALILSSLWEEIPWRKLFFASIATSLVADILAWLQLGIPDLLLIENRGLTLGRPGSTFGNPTFLAGYLIFNIFIAIYLLLEKYGEKTEKYREKVEKNSNFISTLFLYLSIFINVITIFLSQTRGDILAVSAGFFVLSFLFALKPPRLRLRLRFLQSRMPYLAVVIIAIIISLSFWFTRQSAFWDSVPGLNRFRNISFSLSSEDLLPRLIALKAAWKGFLEKPVLGWGPENFNIVFNKYYDPRALEPNYQETRFDKPHNFVLEYLVTGGAVLAISYFVFLLIVLWEARRASRVFGDVILAGFAAYFVANFFVFETIGGLMMIYLVIGYTDGLYRHSNSASAAGFWNRRFARSSGERPPALSPSRLSASLRDRARLGSESSLKPAAPQYLSFIVFATALTLVYVVNVQTFIASYEHYWAFQYMGNGRFKDGIQYFKKAIDIWTPYRWNFDRDYAMAVTEAYFYNPGTISQEEVKDALGAMEQARDEHPLDAYNHYALVDLYNEVSDIAPQKYLALAEKEAEVALKLSPNRQEVYFSLAKTKTLEGNYDEALKLLQYALALDQKVADAHFYYGLVAYAAGDSTTGYRELKEAMALGRQWKNANEPRVAANFFADSGHLDEAISLYQASLGLDPSSLETKIKLGIAYFFQGRYDLAKQYLTEVSKQFDLSQSPAYSQFKPILDKLGIPSSITPTMK